MKWFQCDVITENGRADFWCRFIALDRGKAKQNIERIFKNALKTLSRDEKRIIIRKVVAFKIKRVPDSIIERYNLNNQIEYEKFLKRELG